MVTCSVPKCDVTRRYNRNQYTFHRFPSNPALREKWMRIINRPDWTPSTNSTICSKHFDGKCFIQRKHRRVLMKDSIPTLFVSVTKATSSKDEGHPTTGNDVDEEDTASATSEDDSSEDDTAGGSQSEVPSEQIDTGISCNVCSKRIVGFRYSCVQCSDLELCGACEARHPAHYVLRIPAGRPQWEVSMVVQKVRDEIARNLSEVLSEPEIIKTEIKVEAGPDPLQGDVDSRPHPSNVLEQSIIDIDIVKQESPDPEIDNPVEPPSTAVDEAKPIALDVPPVPPPRAAKRRPSWPASGPAQRRVIQIESGVIASPYGKSSVVPEGPGSSSAGSSSYEVFTHNAQPTDKHKTKLTKAQTKYGKAVKKKS